jgi:hypothetical protein
MHELRTGTSLQTIADTSSAAGCCFPPGVDLHSAAGPRRDAGNYFSYVHNVQLKKMHGPAAARLKYLVWNIKFGLNFIDKMEKLSAQQKDTFTRMSTARLLSELIKIGFTEEQQDQDLLDKFEIPADLQATLYCILI